MPFEISRITASSPEQFAAASKACQAFCQHVVPNVRLKSGGTSKLTLICDATRGTPSLSRDQRANSGDYKIGFEFAADETVTGAIVHVTYSEQGNESALFRFKKDGVEYGFILNMTANEG